MRFEKINENKIRITLSHQDLEAKHIDFHSFMSSSLDSQDLFFDMLDEAEKQIGFVTKDYRIRIEALAMSEGDFIVTVTRSLPEVAERSPLKKKVRIKRKSPTFDNSLVVYCFYSLEDFFSFMEYAKNLKLPLDKLAKSMVVYEYKNAFYFVLDDIPLENDSLKIFFTTITEFASHVSCSPLFLSKLTECGEILLKQAGIKKYIKGA